MLDPPKLYLTQRQVDLFRAHAKSLGHSEDWFDQWIKDYVLIVITMEELMSTHLYLRCISHDPPIESDEVGHSLSHLSHIQRRVAERYDFLAGLKASGLDIWDLDPLPQTDRAMNYFFYTHPNCDYELWDEYKRQHILVPEGPELLEFNKKGPYGSSTNVWVFYTDWRNGPHRSTLNETEIHWAATEFPHMIYFLHDED